MILTPNERSFYSAPDDISFFNIITVPFDTEPSHKFGNSHGFRSFRPPDITAPAL